MKIRPHLPLALLALVPALLFAVEKATDTQVRSGGSSYLKGTAIRPGLEKKPAATDSSPQPDAAPRYPLKGVIVEVQADQSALFVKHEDIPGFMPSMTMLFKVDAATLKTAAKGQVITGTLVQREDGFWLEDVKPVR